MSERPKLMRMAVEMIWDDVLRGTPGAEAKCAVARALQRVFRMPCVVFYDAINLDGGRWSVLTPPGLHAFMNKFDRNGVPAPVIFEIDVPAAMVDYVLARMELELERKVGEELPAAEQVGCGLARGDEAQRTAGGMRVWVS